MSRVVVTGSIATDHLMSFPGRFTEQFVADQLHTVSLSFLVDELTVRRGGVGANIAYGLAQLGLRPTLVGAVGADFADYRSWLERHHVDCSSILVSEQAQTARFICTTDRDMCQIASFYAGAMTEAVDIDLAAVMAAGAPPELVVIAPDVPGAMLRHAAVCRSEGRPFAADPSQQLARMPAADIAEFITGARYLLTNEYEYGLLRSKLGASDADVRAMVEVVVTTRGAAGVRIRTADRVVDVPAVPLAAVVDPTGGGDALRAGFVAAVAHGLPSETAAAVGCQLAGYAIQHPGGQGYEVRHPDLIAGLEAHYGAGTAAAVQEALRPAVAVTGLHATEPAAVYLSCWARAGSLEIADVDRAVFSGHGPTVSPYLSTGCKSMPGRAHAELRGRAQGPCGGDQAIGITGVRERVCSRGGPGGR